MICKECQKEFSEDFSFNRHLRSHKISIAEYWQKWEPKYDLHDGSLIKFKTKDFYFNNQFNSKTNLNHWLKSAPENDRKKYIVDFLVGRKEKKKLVYAPTQIELKTLCIPGMKYINDLFGDYYRLCADLGFINRFSKYSLDKTKFTDISKKVIFKDTREQTPLEFGLQTRTKCINVGDYRMAGSDIRIERKSISDAWGVLSGGIDRFKRELDRAKEQSLYLIVLIEESLNAIYGFPYRWQVRGKVKISPEMPLHNMREILKEYKDVQFVFVKNREEASRIIERIFSAGEQSKGVDIQYLVDLNEI